MVEWIGGISTAGAVALALVGGVLGLLLAALLLRSACDLCSLDPPPSYLRCLGVTLLLVVINAPLAYGIGLGARAVGSTWSPGAASVVAGLLDLPVFAAVCTVTFILAFRVAPLKAFFIWLADVLLNLLVGSVLFLLALGVLTVVGAGSRLF